MGEMGLEREVASDSDVRTRFQLWSRDYLQREAEGRRDSGVMESGSLGSYSFSFTECGGIVGATGVSLGSTSGGDFFTISGEDTIHIVDIGERTSCIDDPDLPSTFTGVSELITRRSDWVSGGEWKWKRGTIMLVEEGHCYLVYTSSIRRGGDTEAFGQFYVEEHSEGRKVVLNEVRRIASRSD